jgi:hypothetical protein
VLSEVADSKYEEAIHLLAKFPGWNGPDAIFRDPKPHRAPKRASHLFRCRIGVDRLRERKLQYLVAI